jgi:isoleucyl-tRNA synthetase
MSKSLGNGVDPVDIANRLGGEIVRLWVASIDFREDMAASENLMQRCAEIYRKLRNTFKILLGNLHGFVPERDRVAEAELLPLDRYMLARTRDLTEKVRAWYEAFEFHRVYHAVNEFVIVDLSSFYIDVLKDRMYTFAPTSVARRSAQTVLWQITEALVRLVAPILSFTADEVWDYLPAVDGREASVHLAQFPRPEEVFSENPDKLLAEWRKLFAIRDQVMQALETARQSKVIGKGLEAKVIILSSAPDTEFLRSFSPETLQEFFNISALFIGDRATNAEELRQLLGYPAYDLQVLIAGPKEDGVHPPPSALAVGALGARCNRCWRHTEDTATYGIWQDVCARCRGALAEMGIAPPQPEPTEMAS